MNINECVFIYKLLNFYLILRSIMRLPSKEEILGASPCRCEFFYKYNNLFLVLSLLNRYESFEILFYIHLSCSFKPLERNIFKKCMLIIHSFYKAAIPSFFCSYKNHKLIIILFSFFEREIAFLCEWIIFGYNFKNWCSKFRNLIEENKKIKFFYLNLLGNSYSTFLCLQTISYFPLDKLATTSLPYSFVSKEAETTSLFFRSKRTNLVLVLKGIENVYLTFPFSIFHPHS